MERDRSTETEVRGRLLRQMPDGLIVVEDNQITFANAAAASLLDWTASELTGQSASEIVPDRAPPTFFDDLAAQSKKQPVSTALRRRNNVEIELELSAWHIDGPGSEIGLLVHARSTSLDFAGTPVDDVQATPARLYKSLFEQAPLGIFHFDARGVITACNPGFAKLLGSEARLVVGLSTMTLPNSGVVEAIRQVIKGQRSTYEGSYVSVTGHRERQVRAAFNPIVDDAGVLEGGVGIVEDITEQQNAERKLIVSERMASLGRLAAGVTHEINNPLSYVALNAEIALNRLREEDEKSEGLIEATEALRATLSGLARIRELVADLRTFARPAPASIRAVVVERAVDEALRLAAHEIRHRARLRRRYTSVPLVRGDQGRLVQVFLNLLVNATDAIKPGHVEENEITVTIERASETEVAVVVTDTGVGIRPENWERIFEPFFTNKKEGTGLGLAICHGIIQSLGGRIEVGANDSGQTQFRVVLNIADEKLIVASSPPPAAALPAPSRRGRLLVIDDERRLAETFRIALAEFHDVVIALDGTEALASLERDSDFDLILCDLMMPDTPGQQIFESAIEKHPHLEERFVFMTGGAFTNEAAEFLARVPNERLEKPFPLERLEALLAAQIERRSAVSRGA